MTPAESLGLATRLAAAYAALSRCMYCGAVGGGDIDHIVPAVRGGSEDAANLCHACERCNRSKSDGSGPLGAPSVDVWVGRLFDELALRRIGRMTAREWTESDSLDRAAAFRVARCREWHGVRVWSAPKRQRASRAAVKVAL